MSWDALEIMFFRRIEEISMVFLFFFSSLRRCLELALPNVLDSIDMTMTKLTIF